MPTRPRKQQSRNIIGERVRQARLRFNPPLTQDQLSGKLASHGVQLDRVALTKIEIGQRCAYDTEVQGSLRSLTGRRQLASGNLSFEATRMSFSTSYYLRKATSRGTSDVANKLISMYLHGVSRRISSILKMNVTDKAYAAAVEGEFGDRLFRSPRSAIGKG